MDKYADLFLQNRFKQRKKFIYLSRSASIPLLFYKSNKDENSF